MTRPDAAASPFGALGGTVVVQELVEQLYVRLLADARLVGHFAGVDMPRLKRHQVLLLSQLLGGPAQYVGHELAAAHAGLGITDADYTALCEHLSTVLHDLGAPSVVVDALGAALEASRAGIVSRPAAPPSGGAPVLAGVGRASGVGAGAPDLGPGR
ncbi:MAG: hypothetical protein JWM64_2587 [Frankiales bacterium]|nr:hypothetical protein [Frankiales bacterium]